MTKKNQWLLLFLQVLQVVDFFMACNLHNSFVRTSFWVFMDSMESPLSQYIDCYNIELIVHPKMIKESGCCRCCKLLIFFIACNLHNSFVRTSLWVFLDSMEINLSLESIHIYLDTILSL